MRWAVLALVLANVLVLGWYQDWWRALGLGPAPVAEPQRLAQQVHPERVRILTEEQYRAALAELAGPRCLQAGPFDAVQTERVRGALEALLGPGNAPGAPWQLDAQAPAERWIIYIGKLANAEALARKRAELVALKLPVYALRNPALEPGLSLGAFDSQTAANAALQKLANRGIRTARVVADRLDERTSSLRINPVDATTRRKLGALDGVLAGRPLQPC